MQKLFMFSVFDSAAKAFLPPFIFPHEDMAIRAFRDCANDPDHQFCKFASDYTLFSIGVFDADTGFISESVPVIVRCATALKEI